MGSDKLFSDSSKLFTNKKFTNVVCVLIGFAFVLICLTFFNNKGSSNNKLTNEGGVAVSESSGVATKETLDDYQSRKQNELKQLLEKMDGVGKVDVIINFEGGEVKVPAIDENTQVSNTEEKDTQGGTRTNRQETGGSKVVMAGESGNEALILQTNNPKVIGIMIAAEGAESEKVKYEIQKAVSSLYDISFDKVNVYRMKE